MRPLLLLMAVGAGCSSPCANGTLFVSITYRGAALQAELASVDVTVDGSVKTSVVHHSVGAPTGTLEVDFPDGYPLGKSVDVTVTALTAGVEAGHGSGSVVLPRGCTTLALTVEGESAADMASADLTPPPDLTATPTVSHLSPGGYTNNMNGTARPIVWTIASETPATIYYTTDGSAPSLSSAHGDSPLNTAALPNGTTLRWFAFNGAQESPQSFAANVVSPGTDSAIIESVHFDGGAPVITVKPGASIAVQLSYQVWCSLGPPCEMQLTYGVDTQSVASGCLLVQTFNNMGYPGLTGTANLTVIAPTTPGLHLLRMGYFLQASCASASSFGILTSHMVLGYIVVAP